MWCVHAEKLCMDRLLFDIITETTQSVWQGCSPGPGRRTRAGPELAGGIIQYVPFGLRNAWIPQEELESVAGERNVWVYLINLGQAEDYLNWRTLMHDSDRTEF